MIKQLFYLIAIGFMSLILNSTALAQQQWPEWMKNKQKEISWTGCGITKKAFMSEVAKVYQEKTGVAINLSGGGATKGIREVAAGKVDIGGSCRHRIPHPEEKGVRMHHVAWDALAVIVHPRNPVDDITFDQLQGVMSGRITNWGELGGMDRPIKVFTRKGKISGVGLMSRELLFADTDMDFHSTQEFPSTGPLEKALEQEPQAIAIDGISSAKKRDLKVLRLNGVYPTMDNISTGSYKLFRPLYLVTNNKTSLETKQFLHWLRSREGQKVIESQGTLPYSKGRHLRKEFLKNMAKVRGSHKSVMKD